MLVNLIETLGAYSEFLKALALGLVVESLEGDGPDISSMGVATLSPYTSGGGLDSDALLASSIDILYFFVTGSL
jgi:hypothetical protein